MNSAKLTELTVPGFAAAAVQGNIRRPDKLDIGLIYSEVPAVAAGVFTTSLTKAAPVLLDMERVLGGRGQAILVNSSIANACTGAIGMKLAKESAALAAAALGIAPELVLVASTGVIGMPLDVSKFAAAMPALVAALAPAGFKDVSRAIMTTDTVPKTAVRTLVIEGHEIKLLGLAKGAGMIMPNMATMLSFILTDAAVSASVLQAMLQKAVALSFNRITIDGDTSTNDTVLLLANGKAGNPEIDAFDSASAVMLQGALDDLLKDLARQIVADGEGATKLITVRVENAVDEKQADLAARAIANSSLVKTAFFGEDANWGRIFGALGRSGASFDPYQIDLFFDTVQMVKDGMGLDAAVEAKATEVLQKKQFTLRVDLKAGSAAAEILTCDLSIDYVKINADYRS